MKACACGVVSILFGFMVLSFEISRGEPIFLLYLQNYVYANRMARDCDNVLGITEQLLSI